MVRKRLMNTPLCVSPLCLGTAQYGAGLPEADAMRQMDAFFEAGGNFLDTAHVYNDWVPGIAGRSERTIGAWLKANGNRKDIVISTKGAHPPLGSMGTSRVHPQAIEQDLSESLQRLDVARIDLYFLHRDDTSVPVDELVDCLQGHADEGRITAYGCSNWTLDRLRAANEYAAANGRAGFACNQLRWSLADVDMARQGDPTLVAMDAAMYAYHAQAGLNAMAYASNAGGYFSRLLSGAPVSEAQRGLYDSPANARIAEGLAALSEGTGHSVAALSLAALMHHPFVSVPVAAFRTPEQLREGLESCAPALTEAIAPEVLDSLQRLYGMKLQ